MELILEKEIKIITDLSNKYGGNSSFVLAGGGNTSVKNKEFLWVKPSGTSLATIKEEQFLKMDREKLQTLFSQNYPENSSEREDVVKNIMLAAIAPGYSGRPSVEAPLHNIFEAKFVVHTHPASVNGMTCSIQAEEICKKLFPEALWVEYIDPGYTLAAGVKNRLDEYSAKNGKQPSVVFLQNHGVFVAGNSAEEIDAIYKNIMDTLDAEYKNAGVATELITGKIDDDAVLSTAPKLRILMSADDRVAVASSAPFAVPQGPLSPDHIVYTKSYSFSGEVSSENISAFEKEKGYLPIVVSQKGAVFSSGTSVKTAQTAMAVAKDGALVAQLTKAFGGPNYLADKFRLFIENWEVESYRKKVSLAANAGRLQGKIAVVTGGAQGFGKGIAEELAKEGAYVVIADLNIEGAEKCAAELCEKFGAGISGAAAVNISSEESVEEMTKQIVKQCGGIDLFVANAGVLKAGSVKEMSLKDWKFVTDVNYTGYFLCAKYVSRVMAAQNIDNRGSWMDIVQINSKSGLQGSNKNGAYAGSKFGTIGLTQSFAKELVTDRIKVNSVCPGNFFDGPLWSDPERGLFKQYLDTGKVPGAKTVDDVKRFYEKQVPMGRGCYPADVAKAILYCVEQTYETGQAIPVAGGQVMLK